MLNVRFLIKFRKPLNKRVRIEAFGYNSKKIQIRRAFQTLVRLLRLKSGFNVEQFANQLGVDTDYIIELEHNISYRPSPLLLNKLSQVFQIPNQKLNFLAGAIKDIPQDLQSQASQFAAQSDSLAKLTENEKKLVDEFVEFLRQEST